jgi:hypothetical protein
MARDKKPVPGEQPQEREEMTVVVLKFKGGSQSLQKGFDAVTQAIAALGGPAPHDNHRAAHQRQAAQLAPVADEIIDTEAQDADVVDDPDALEQAVAPKQRKASAAPKQRKASAAPKYTFMDDFDLTPGGVPSLKDYCDGKDPQNENDKFLVASARVQTHGSTDPFTGQHLFTAFRAMEWKTQVDMTQPMRALKQKKSYYDNPAHGKWKLTGIGLNAAEAIVKA